MKGRRNPSKMNVIEIKTNCNLRESKLENQPGDEKEGHSTTMLSSCVSWDFHQV